MTRRVLLGWELGANQGHAARLRAVAEALRARGIEPVFAVQRLDSALFAGADEVWQAPVWPGLLRTAATPRRGGAHSLGDILADLGLDKPETTGSLVSGWDRLLSAIQPAAVVADFAPMLLLAARGRVPAVATGTGFTLPPPELPAFPSLTGRAPHDEAPSLDAVNAGLTRAGRLPLDRLPELFAAETVLPAVFPAFDPYRELRSTPPMPPFATRPKGQAGGGREVFAYLQDGAHVERLREGLIRSGLPLRIHAAPLSAEARAAFETVGAIIETEPATVDSIVARSRLLVSHGGLSLASSALLAGLPHIVVWPDLEKRLNGLAVHTLGVGATLGLARLDPDAFAADLRSAYASPRLHARTGVQATVHRAKLGVDPAQSVADAAVRLIGHLA